MHVRDASVAPQQPQWSDITPIMTQYANLYPVMSRGLFDLAQQAVVDRHAKILGFAFSRPIDDPNHMPVTRDLSAGKREMILRYLDSAIAGEPAATPEPTPAPTSPQALPERSAEPIDHAGGRRRRRGNLLAPRGVRTSPDAFVGGAIMLRIRPQYLQSVKGAQRANDLYPAAIIIGSLPG